MHWRIEALHCSNRSRGLKFQSTLHRCACRDLIEASTGQLPTSNAVHRISWRALSQYHRSKIPSRQHSPIVPSFPLSSMTPLPLSRLLGLNSRHSDRFATNRVYAIELQCKKSFAAYPDDGKCFGGKSAVVLCLFDDNR